MIFSIFPGGVLDGLAQHVGEFLVEDVSFHPEWYTGGEPIETDETDE